MFSKSHRDVMKPSYAAIIESLKRSDGMPVSDLSRELKMSYMGVKQHCQKLTSLGYLEEWRVPIIFRNYRTAGYPR